MIKKIKCFIVDDDPDAIELLRDYIKEMPGLELERSFINPLIALDELKSNTEDILLFLDIDMPNFSGLHLAKQLKSVSHHIIFTTGHSKYALPAWEVSAKKFLLKPFEFCQFVDAITDVLNQFPKQSKTEDYFYIITDRGVNVRIIKDDLIYIQGAQNYVDFFLKNVRYTAYLTLKELEAQLCYDNSFFRIHKSYIINTSFIKKKDGNMIYLHEKDKVNMSGEYRSNFLGFLKQHTLFSDRLKL